ncbi:MAG TPA: hypothetical protein DEQ68_05055, partial [Ruminococcaceae bacterium]|nr:hypothetical protein [Oscillospiraceae bacterium]
LPVQGWVFVLSDTSAELLADAVSLRITLIVICAVCMTFLTVWVYLVVWKLLSPLKRVEAAVVRLENIDLSAGEAVKDLAKSPDEVGTIASAVVNMS